jgi:hypothetical protein
LHFARTPGTAHQAPVIEPPDFGDLPDLNQLLQKVNRYDFCGHPELIEMHRAMKAAHVAHHQLVAAIMAELGVQAR